MLTDSIRDFLAQPLVARVTTIDPDGYPHTVPIWYVLDGDEIVIATGPTSRKIRNIRVNPKGAVTVGGDAKTEDGRDYDPGYLLQGEFAVETDPDQRWLRRIAHHYRSDDQIEHDIAEWGQHDVIRLTIRNVIQVMP